MSSTLIPADLALSRRLERAEAYACLSFVEARRRLSPESGAEWKEFDGVFAMFDGPRSPVTQVFGLGIFQPVTAAELEPIEAFFTDRGAPVFFEVSPLAGVALAALLVDRGYRPVEFSSVMFMPIGSHGPEPSNPAITVRIAGEADHYVWAQTAAEGWRELAGISDLMLDIGIVSAARAGGQSFLAETGGRAIATGSLCIHEGVALMAGASTIPEARNRGAQRALFEARLRYAKDAGCDLAMVCTEPGSASQRNAERQGFRIAYTRTKWARG